MSFPSFDERPDEKNILEPEIINFLTLESFDVVVLDGKIDLLIKSKNCSPDRFLELKVCLSGEGKSPPISAKQWKLLRSIDCGSVFDARYRVLIYDHARKLYSLVSAPQIATGLQENEPRSTSYISAACLRGLPWQSPELAGLAILSWAAQCR